MPKTQIAMTVNGRPVEALVEPRTLLIHFLRDELALTGPHIGCETSHCGACTVDIDGQAVKSCTVLAVMADGASITTIEGVADDAHLHAIQEAFVECGGAQCGICTPGMVLAAHAMLARNPHPTDDEVRAGLSGNLCRCTGYMRIFESVFEAVRRRP